MREGVPVEISLSELRIIFCPFDRLRKRPISSCDEPHDQFGSRIECGRALGRVEHPESAGSAGSDIEQSATLSHMLNDDVDGFRDLSGLGRDSMCDLRILAIDQVDDLTSAQSVD